MTTLRDAMADFIADYWYGEISRETVHKDADAFLEAMENLPEPARLELAEKLNPFRPMELEVVALLCPPEWRCDECGNGIEAHWNWCAWCGRNLTRPVPPSEDK